MKVYSIYDKVGEESGNLFEAKNDAIALRIFSRLQFPEGEKIEDYDLYCVGYFDRDKVLLTALGKSRLVRGESDVEELDEAV